MRDFWSINQWKHRFNEKPQKRAKQDKEKQEWKPDKHVQLSISQPTKINQQGLPTRVLEKYGCL